MEFQLSYFKSWKMMLWKCCTQYASKFGKLSSGHRTGKCQFSFQSQRILKYCTIAPISHTSKVMLKILQTRLQQYVSCELPDVQAGFRKGRGTRDRITNIHWIINKAREFQKNMLRSLVHIASFHWLSVLHMVMYVSMLLSIYTTLSFLQPPCP